MAQPSRRSERLRVLSLHEEVDALAGRTPNRAVEDVEEGVAQRRVARPQPKHEGGLDAVEQFALREPRVGVHLLDDVQVRGLQRRVCNLLITRHPANEGRSIFDVHRGGRERCSQPGRDERRHLSEQLGVRLGLDERVQRPDKPADPCARLGVGGRVLREGAAHIRREQLDSQLERLEAEVRIGSHAVLVGRCRRLRLRLLRLRRLYRLHRLCRLRLAAAHDGRILAEPDDELAQRHKVVAQDGGAPLGERK